MGGVQNFLKQHNPGRSKACKKYIEKKKKTNAHQQSQPAILSFFTKQPKDVIPPTIPVPTPVIAYAMESKSTSQFSGSRATVNAPGMTSLAPNTHVVNILATLEKAVRNIPALPDATESDEIVVFSGSIPTDLAKEDAWEYLDPILNRFLGFNRTSEDIYNALRGRPRGLSAMVRYLQDFTGQYQIDGALLEGKIERLVKVIETQCVAIDQSKYPCPDIYWTPTAQT